MSVYEPRSELDLLAVQRDDAQLDEIARRRAREPVADAALALLTALTVEVDAGLDDLLASPLRVPLDSETPAGVRSLAEAGRRRAARAVTAALIVTSLASVSGVAAAVTGDPLAPYRSVISSVSGEDKGLPEPRITEAEVQERIRSIDASIDAGQLGRAQSGVQRLRATLDQRPGGSLRSVLARVEALEAKLARAIAKAHPTPVATPPVEARKPKDKVVPPGQSRRSTEPTLPSRAQVTGQPGQPATRPSPRATPKAAPEPAASKPADAKLADPQPADPQPAAGAQGDNATRADVSRR